jgi:hypothetical protein
LETGEVWRASTIEYVAEEAPDFEDPDRWLYVGPQGSHEGYRDVDDFIATVDEPGRADRLGIAIDERGAFPALQGHDLPLARGKGAPVPLLGRTAERTGSRVLSFAGYRVAPNGLETATESEPLDPC